MKKLLLASLLFFAPLCQAESKKSDQTNKEPRISINMVKDTFIKAGAAATIFYFFYDAMKIAEENKSSVEALYTMKKISAYTGATVLSGLVLYGANRLLHYLK